VISLPVIPGYTLEGILHSKNGRVVVRARDGQGKPVAIKTLTEAYPEPSEVAELRREHELMSRLQIEGVLQARELIELEGGSSVAIAMDLFGISLAEWAKQHRKQPLSIEEFIAIAIDLVGILGRVHEADVVHKDLALRNILYEPDTGSLRLIDFGIASELPRERQDHELPRRLEGSLPYISPEQTGRMNRDLDYRSDYYSLGISFFELLTGTLPFQAHSALEWVHCHISQPPPDPRSLRPDLPPALGQIVLKLLSKDADDRYQSTFGLAADLKRCLSEPGFPLGESDISRRFHIPQRIFGRQTELGALFGCFDSANRGENTLCLVAGYSGVGKSALVRELSRSIVGERGYLIEGKFDQFQQNTPYYAIIQALRGLARQLLAEPEAQLEAQRSTLAATLGPNARLLVDRVPELRAVLGDLPPVVALPHVEAKNRLHLAFIDFIRVFTTNPLVLVLDDLQWSDGPTLALLERIATTRGLGKLLVVGTYRSNQVDTGHPLLRTIDRVAQSRPFTTIELKPLDPQAVCALTAATVLDSTDRSRELAAVLYDKAQGNPFFVTELLKRFYETGVLRFQPDAGHWEWDLEQVRRAQVGDNVVDFMVASLRRLDPQLQRTLQLAASIGNQFDLRTLVSIRAQPAEAIHAELLQAMKRGLVAPLTDNYRYAGQSSDELGVWFRFPHDRIQQAAYALIEPGDRAQVHLHIGRLLEAHASPEERTERLMEIVGHLDEGRTLIQDPAERSALAQGNLAAAEQAQSASAWEAALGFLRIALELLDEDWGAHPESMMRVCTQIQHCTYLTGDTAEAERWSHQLELRARTPLQRAELLATRTRQYSTSGKMAESIRSAIAGLTLLGIDFQAEPDSAAIDEQLAQIEQNLRGRDIAGLIHAPAVTEPKQLLAMRLLMEIFPAAFLSGSGQLFPYLVLAAVNLTLRHGNSPESAFAYAAYGMLLCGALDDPARGLRFGKLAVRMNEELDDIGLKSRVIYVYTMFIHHWSHHWSTMTQWFQRGIESGRQSGDLLYLAYSAQDCIIWDPRLDLPTASKQQRGYLSVVRDTGYQDSYDSGSLFLQLQLNLMGQTRGQFSLDTEDFDEAAVLAGMHQRGFMTGVANHQIYKAEIHVAYGDFEGALPHIQAMDTLIASAMSLPQLVRFHLLAFLTRASLLPQQPEPIQREWAERLRAGRVQMGAWASHCSVNFAHLHALMEAELAALDGRIDDALGAYGTAIDSAIANGWTRDAATAHERAARFLLDRRLDRAAEGYLRAAHQLYRRWGAARKVALLEEQHPFLYTPAIPTADTLRTSSGKIDLVSIDLASIIKASQSIAGELVLDQLWSTTLHALVQNAGAQRGCFVLHTPEGLVLQAVSGDLQARYQVPQRLDPQTAPAPFSMVRAALRTGEPIVLSDARQTHRFQSDPYLVRNQPRSVLVVPIDRRGGLKGAIYLENDVTTGAFTADRVAVLELLAAQAIVATENAELSHREKQATELNQQLAEESAHKSRHLADMSHELRTPLNAIIGYAELLGEEARDAGIDELVPDLERIETAAHFLLRLINGVLDLSKIEAGRMEVQMESVALDPLLHEICTTLQPVAATKHNQLVWERSGICVRADALRTRQILTNLIGNAAKFTRDGTVEVRATRAGSTVRIEVHDTGVGISEDALVSLFEPYQQASSGTAAKFGGTGLGLAIARKLSMLMNGSLSATSTMGEGSVFTLTLAACPLHPE